MQYPNQKRRQKAQRTGGINALYWKAPSNIVQHTLPFENTKDNDGENVLQRNHDGISCYKAVWNVDDVSIRMVCQTHPVTRWTEKTDGGEELSLLSYHGNRKLKKCSWIALHKTAGMTSINVIHNRGNEVWQKQKIEKSVTTFSSGHNHHESS